MNPSSPFGAQEDGSFETLWEDGERVFCRGQRLDAGGNHRVVVAVLPVADHPTTLAGFAHEYGLRDALDGAWAVRPLELVREHGRTILVLEDHGCKPLERLLGPPMEVGSFLRLAVSLALAIRCVHARGLVHKDLRPANVLVSSAGDVRLTGFGIASRLPRERQAPDPPEIIGGSLAYIAPEQTGRMNRSIDTRSDLYSLGITFYRMLTGSLPFSASDPMEWVHCHIARHPVPPNERISTVPEIVAAIVLKLLAKDAGDRYQTAAGVEADLRRCLSEWKAHGRIEGFSLAEQDASDHLLIPEKLYGREAEIEDLFGAFDRVVTEGMTEIALISGHAGIGKSSVVNELHKVLVLPRGLFASGKFDQYKRDIPYATLAQAFASLVRQLLGKDDEEISRWRRFLLEALGSNGQLMVNLIPELALVIGEQPPVPELPPQEGQHRFQRVFRRFLGVFARPEHPLALFLDDLQWLDTATLDMLEHLATHPEVKHLLLVGSYRDNEVGPAHPLSRILRRIRRTGRRMQETILAPLKLDAVRQMVVESLRCDQVSALPLAHLIHQKTDGNPFFAIQFFMALSEDGLLQFDYGRAMWTWDITSIAAKDFSANVIDLIAVKLNRLSHTTRNALARLAFLGNLAQIATTTQIFGETEENMDRILSEAVIAGLVFKVNGAYRFLHDRVHEAAYGLIPESERAAAHLRIGRELIAKTATDALQDAIFDIVNHLNRGAALMAAPNERERLATLNLLAGKRAKGSTAYASARKYLAQATLLLSADAWAQRYEETFELHLLLSECEYLIGNFEAADALFDTILERAPSDLDCAKVHSLRIKLYQVAGKYSEALAVARSALRRFGVVFPDGEEEIKAAIDAQFRDVTANLRGRAIGELLEAPVAADPVKRAIIDLLVETAPCAYVARPPLFPLVSLEAVNRSMRDGNTDQSSFVYALNASMLVSRGDITAGYQFSELSMRLNERFGNPRLRGTLLHLHGDHIRFWKQHFATGLPILEQAFAACLDVGELVYAGFLAFETVWQLIEKGDALADVLSASSRYAAFAQQSHNDHVYETIQLEQRFIASLQGRTRGQLTFDDDTFDEAACFSVIVKAAFRCGIAFYHIMKQILAVIHGRYAEAMEAAARAGPALAAVMTMPIEVTYHFCHALSLTALYSTASTVQQEDYRRLLDEILAKLRLWAEHCPDNYRNRHALVAAEVARIECRGVDAMHLYEEAIRSAHENGFAQNEAIASELAGRFYLGLGLETNGYAHLGNARACFTRWGAHGKVRQLESQYPRLNAAEVHSRTSTIDGSMQKLDVTTVVKAAQAVTSEIELPKLIERLMKVALENAGANRGVLIFPEKGDYLVGGVAEVRGGEIILRQGSLSAEAVPDSLIRYVSRTQASVILDDAVKSNPFGEDDYFARGKARSVFCLPLVRQTVLAGVLYLENTLTAHVFTADRTTLLGLLASQLAISLENTRLYSDLREREAKIRRLVDANIIGIFIFDFEGRIIEANDAFLRMVGYDRGDFASGRVHWMDLTPPEWRERHARAWAELKSAGTVQPYEREYFRKDGSRVPALIGSAQLEERGNEGVAFVLDLTERRRAAEALREVQMELAHANRVATMGQLTASIAHEVNQPIGAAVTNAQAALRWLRARPPNLEEVQHSLTRIVRDATRAGDVVGRIRDLIKKAPPQRDSVDINEAVREVIELTRSEAAKTGVSVKLNLTSDLPLVEGDRVQLQQVVLNLVVNAVQAMSVVPDGVRDLLVETAPAEPNGVLVAVRDAGAGVASGSVDRIFDPFYSTKPGGLGMGLSICQSIIAAHQGRIWATANQPRGTIFHFTVPAHRGGDT